MKKSLRMTTFVLLTAMRYFLITFSVTVLLAELLFANKSSGQRLHSAEVTLSASEKTIAQVINEIESKTKLNFVYNPDELSENIIFTNIRFKKEKVLHVLNKLGYTGIEEGEHIILRKLDEFDQLKVIVTGTITDITGLPLPGVTISIKNSPHGVITNADGQYSIDVEENETLIFNMLGFEKQEIAVNSQKKIDLVLKESKLSLSEVVIVGYGTQKRAEVTSAITTIKPKDFNEGGAKSVVDLIRGKVAGLSITRVGGNNNPNAGSSIQLRGVTSLSGTNSPLIVIDGIPGGDLRLLQQDDIESFDILKDGSAAAIYGTRANGGVILITTKKGKSGEPRYDYSNYFAHDELSQRPDVLSAEEFRALMVSSPVKRVDDGASVDYYDLLLDKNNLTQYHNFAASGGSSATNYRASIFYNDQNGIALQNGNKQYGGRLNINQRGLKDRLTLQMNLATNINNSNNIGGNGLDFEQAVQQNPTSPVTNSDGSFFYRKGNYYYNPIARINQEQETGTRQTFSGDAKFTLDIYKGLKASVFGSILRNNYLEEGYRLKSSMSSVENYSGGGYAYKNTALGVTRTIESTVEYSKSLLSGHSLNTILGYGYQDGLGTSFSANNSGFISDAFEDNSLGAGADLALGKAAMSSIKETNTLIAFFGRANYSYKGKYLASFILRHEGSSRFGKNNKWGNFPAVSVGWNLGEENFIKNLKVVDALKLRMGYGVTGNQDIGNYRSLVTLSQGGYYLNGTSWTQTYGPGRNPNPDLRWEKKKEINIGVDFSLLQSRLSGSIDVYRRETEDLLGDYNTQLPPYVTDKLFTNVGSLENKGIELALSALAVKKTNFAWNIDVTANTQRNKVLSISNDVFKASFFEYGTLSAPGSLGNTIRAVEGGPLGNFYGKRFAGFTDAGKWLFYKADGSTSDVVGTNPNDYAVLGNGVPKYMASLNNSFRYKNLDLSIFLRGKFDFDVLNLQDLYYGNPESSNNLLRSAVTKHKDLKENIQYSDYYLEKGDFVKLDNISLGYNVKLRTSYIRNLRVYGSCQNVATFTKFSGLDPEVQDTGLTTGIDGRTFYPYTRTFTLGLNVGF